MTTTQSTTQTTTAGTGRIGDSPLRPDATLKVTGEFAYASDLWHDDMVWGVTLRSPHPHARILGIDVSAALAVPGVSAVLTADDVPGHNAVGLEHLDTPALATGVVRYEGEPVALVAADHPETARRAAKRIVVDYEVLPAVTDPRRALDDDAPVVHEGHEGGNLVRKMQIRRGDPAPTAPVVVALDFEVGMQDQAFLGPESGLAVPAADGGVDLFVATQWLHVDQGQICRVLGLPPEKVRLTLAGVGGAFGGREDLSIHVHACLLALRTGKPVKMSYARDESFYGHVHRHPAWLRYEFGAETDGTLVYAGADILFDGGAYASSTGAVVGNGGTLGLGPYRIPSVRVDARGVYTNNPPCGAMRGFGCVQAAFAHEALMDELADRVGVDRVEIRALNGMREGDHNITGQLIDSAAPVAELIRIVRDMPLPAPREDDADIRELPGGVSNTTHGEGVVRGVGYAVTYKNVGFSEGFDDYSTARVRLEMTGGEPVVTVHTAAAEVGQGLITVEQQICRTELGVERVVVHPKDTTVGSGGSTSASRQTYVTGGAVKAACEAVRASVLARVGVPDCRLEGDKIVSAHGEVVVSLAEVLGDGVDGPGHVEETVEWRHRPTHAIDPETGQGDAHVQYAFSAHRAVVDVDVELGLVKVVALDTAQDVGRAINPDAVIGQIQGGSAQGMGLALMEEIVVTDGKVRNPSFTDYLIPTILDMPPMQVAVLEYADPHAPYGVRGVGEPPTISSGPAVAAAIRAATGKALHRVPVRPEHIVAGPDDAEGGA
ncbi:molybdopterin-dependent oxidoreductase [Pseudonocardia sp. KRD-184]|uniref:Molybdopterin-dependent oxidoreductase n=1 Tax=Pseudonocardia oceani TaxID=2792013 RepID=A0ABS6U1T1_9PSEU|nr:molybdopterin cofactor-binding domain-containing protein [Pseudonocardia oceani]MBW0090452.1 molybdopterin-dependent oxidoreductase [Pseudonocardia oceani]MBW0098235.1 molybdopterin-dependent oxidoreductase [Pseudonocardia oceani]MBW0110199.1 molybdopterin-dependent oxidoreductase [Pseudonocardia oceani]MBW0124234.1 molybdopterin-dependent oxidoreductase [Pseudonocardia oceani]MBW0126182.1 molybdopterin-dependent oxidoreductase [Pseudonocardia oceani]